MDETPYTLDEQIRQAIQRGDFDNLPGKGKPLRLDENPFADPGWRLAYHILKEHGYTLPWIETRRNLELDYEQASRTLQQSWHRHRLMQNEQEWQQALQTFREQMTRLNQRIRDYNLEIPSTQFQRRPIHIEQEILKITASSD